MTHPLAWFITWTTYGTWLHGDPRGSFLQHKALPPDAALEAVNRSALTEVAVLLSADQRALVDSIIRGECEVQGWELHECNVRSNHVHVVVTAGRTGTFVRSRLKALGSEALSDDAGLPMAGQNGRRRWWTEKGNIVAIETERSLEEVIVYVRDLQ